MMLCHVKGIRCKIERLVVNGKELPPAIEGTMESVWNACRLAGRIVESKDTVAKRKAIEFADSTSEEPRAVAGRQKLTSLSVECPELRDHELQVTPSDGLCC